MIGIFAITSVFSGAAFAEDALGRQWDSDCEKNQLSMNMCASLEYEKVNAELNRLYAEQMSFLKSDIYKKALREAQRAWITFRDKDCFYQTGPDEQRGSLDDYIESTCKYVHTKRRVEDIKNYVSCRENGCPY